MVRNVVIVRLCACFVGTAEAGESEDVSIHLLFYPASICLGDRIDPISVRDSGELGRAALQWSFTALLCWVQLSTVPSRSPNIH